MKRQKYPSASQILNATRVEVYQTLASKYGSPYQGSSYMNETGDKNMNFQLDRLFTVFHSN